MASLLDVIQNGLDAGAAVYAARREEKADKFNAQLQVAAAERAAARQQEVALKALTAEQEQNRQLAVAAMIFIGGGWLLYQASQE